VNWSKGSCDEFSLLMNSEQEEEIWAQGWNQVSKCGESVGGVSCRGRFRKPEVSAISRDGTRLLRGKERIVQFPALSP
jgi:hypothetical protein